MGSTTVKCGRCQMGEVTAIVRKHTNSFMRLLCARNPVLIRIFLDARHVTERHRFPRTIADFTTPHLSAELPS